MYKHYFNIIAIGCFVFFSSCSATKIHTLSALEPASVDLSVTITKIGIVNESVASGESAYTTRIEQLLSVKDRQLEKEGKDAAIAGLFDELLKDQRFDTVQLIETEFNNGKGLGDSTENISWSAIKDVCDTHNVDAIFSLAYYEADTQVSLKKKAVEEQNMLRQYIKVQGHEITLETLIENGWRIYDPYNKKVIDEIVFNDHITSIGTGTNPVYALEDVSDRREAVLEQSKHSGSNYGLRLLPQERDLQRDYFVRGTEKFIKAQKLIDEGDWEGAAALWEAEVTNGNPKIKSRASYNMAFYNEFKGDLEAAMDWATISYGYDENKVTLDYLKALRDRIDQNKIVQQQLERSALSASIDLP